MFIRKRTFGMVLLALFLGDPSAIAWAGPKTAERPQTTGGYDVASVLAIGGADADDDSFFYEKYGSVVVDADREGRIYVLDNGNIRVQVFDDRGALVRSLGSEGEGPGEFLIPGKISVNGEGEVAIYDLGTSRISVLDAEGNLRRDQIVGGGVEDLVLRDDGGLYVGYGSPGAGSRGALRRERRARVAGREEHRPRRSSHQHPARPADDRATSRRPG